MSKEDTSEIDKNLIQGHDYDGIQELDNPLPDWWLFTFYATIIFSFIYFIHYHLGGGGDPSDVALKKDMAKIEALRGEAVAAAPAPSEVSVESLLADSEKMKLGQQSYVQNCASCHLQDGGGSIGPNLTDNYWIHGQGDFETIVTLIKNGITEKGMPPWEGIIPPDKINYVAAYVMSLQGTTPANPKAPQGELVE